MKEIIELLNQTSALRTVFYCIVFLVALGITVNAIVKIIELIFKRQKD